MERKRMVALALAAVAIAILAYYMLFSIAFPPYSTIWGNYCVTGSPIKCTSSSISTLGIVTVTIKQSHYQQINVTAIGCNRLGSVANMSQITPPRVLLSNQSATLSVGCYDKNTTLFSGAAGDTYSGYVMINYTIAGGNKFTTAGIINLKVG